MAKYNRDKRPKPIVKNKMSQQKGISMGIRAGQTPSAKNTRNIINKAERQAEVSRLYKQGLKQVEIAEKMQVSRWTINRDIRDLLEMYKESGMYDFDERVIQIVLQYDEQIKICQDRLQRLEQQPHQGARWLELWQGALAGIARLLGLNAAEKVVNLKLDGNKMSKEENDAFVRNAIRVVQEQKSLPLVKPENSEDVIDVEAVND